MPPTVCFYIACLCTAIRGATCNTTASVSAANNRTTDLGTQVLTAEVSLLFLEGKLLTFCLTSNVRTIFYSRRASYNIKLVGAIQLQMSALRKAKLFLTCVFQNQCELHVYTNCSKIAPLNVKNEAVNSEWSMRWAYFKREDACIMFCLRHQFGKISTCSLIMIRSAMYESYYACKTGEREEEMQTISHTLHMGFFLLTKNT